MSTRMSQWLLYESTSFHSLCASLPCWDSDDFRKNNSTQLIVLYWRYWRAAGFKVAVNEFSMLVVWHVFKKLLDRRHIRCPCRGRNGANVVKLEIWMRAQNSRLPTVLLFYFENSLIYFYFLFSYTDSGIQIFPYGQVRSSLM